MTEETKPKEDAAPAGGENLAEALSAAEAKAADYFDQLLRLKAEFENYRKRVEREKIEARKWGKEEIVLRLVSLMDVMEQAEAVAHKSVDVKSIVLGLDMLYGEFKRLLKEEGLEEVPAAAGGPYDHAVHEAVETEDGEDGKIVAVLQKGYRFQGGLFRPARVKISKAKAVPVEKSQDDAPAI